MTIRLSISKAVTLFGVITLMGLAAVILTNFLALKQLKVGGPVYTEIKLGNDLVADILPPPEYVIEAYLEATLALREPATLEARQARLKQLRKDYDERKVFWAGSDLSASLKSMLTEKSDAVVQRFWKAVEDDLLPALARGDSAAAEKAYGQVTSTYNAHRAVIDSLVELANQKNTELEQTASQSDFSYSAVAWSVSAAVLAIVVLGLLGIAFGVVRPIARMTAAMKEIAAGNLAFQIPFIERSDEIGSMASAMQIFKESAAENERLRNDQLTMSEKTEEERRKILHEMCEMLESDLDSAVGEVLSMSSDAALRGASAAADARSIAAESVTVASSSDQASNNVTAISAAAEELSVTGREIAARAADTAKFAGRAAEQAAQASATVIALNEAAERIASVVSTISEVASQTNLLALNATIEAARAGESGRGFAVVAHEVKALARKTGDAADDIARRIENICSATKDSVAVINNISGAVNDINGVSAAVAAAAEEQEATLREVSRSLQEASIGVSSVARNVTHISNRSTEIEQSSNLVSGLVNGTNGRVAELRANLVVSLRESSAGDRRSTDYRRPVMIPAAIRTGATSLKGAVLDLSQGGLRFRADAADFDLVEGQPASVETSDFGTVTCTILAIGKTSIHVQFHKLDDDRQAAVSAYLRSVDAADQRLVDAAKQAAGQIGVAFEAAIERRDISEQQMFDFRYQPIAGSDPEQFETAFTAICDRVLPQFQDPILKLDPRIVFCAAVDIKSYLPTHNAQFSQPQRANDPIWNAANSRNRRFFKDRAGMTAARTMREFLMQTYDRNMGGGKTVTLKEIDVPIRIHGRHWGGLRLAFTA